MNKKKLNKTVWYSSELDENKNPILPPIADSPTDLNGLHEGEIFLHNSDEDPSIWIRTSSGKIQRLKGTGENVSFWELMTDENGNKYIFTKYHLVTQLGLTMYSGEDGLNLPSIYDGLPIDSQTIYWEDIKDGNGVVIGKILKAKTGGGTLGSLTNVGEWADSVADVDRIMVQKKGSDTWEAMDVSGIGSASFENISESGEGNAYTSFELSEDKKFLTLVKGETFALASDIENKWTTDEELINNWNTAFGWGNHAEAGYALQTSLDLVSEKLNNFLEGSDTDSIINKWKELEVFLGGLTESDNLAEILATKANQSALEETNKTLATKWTKDDTKIANWDAAFSWGDHSKAGYAAKSYVDSTFVTIAGNEDVTGVHNFVNGLKIGGKLIDKPQDDVIYIDANLVVRGGITMYGDRDANIPSILNSIPTAGYDDIQARGLIAFNSKHFVINNGVVSAIQGSAGLDVEQLEDYLTSNKYTTEEWVKQYVVDVNTGNITAITKQMVIDALEYTPYDASNPNGYITSASIPSALPNPYGLTFGDKIYDGNEAKTISASDLGALTSESNLDWGKVINKPTTISGYGITDAITTSNIGSQSVSYATSSGDADTLDNNHISDISKYIFTVGTAYALTADSDLNTITCGYYTSDDNVKYTNAPITNFGLLNVNINGWYRGQLLLPYNSNSFRIRYRSHVNSNGEYIWCNWRELAYIDDNVASATYATTAGNAEKFAGVDFATLVSIIPTNTNQLENGAGFITSSDFSSLGVITTSNYDSYALRADGWLGVDSNDAPRVYRASGVPYINFRKDGSTNYGSLGVNENGQPVWFDDKNGSGWHFLIHSENIGSQSVSYATSAGSCTGNAATATYAESAGSCTGNAATATYAESAGSSTKAYQDGNGDNIVNTYLAKSSYTASDVLSKLKTVDGTNSGIDADLLDGQHGSYYASVASLDNYFPKSGGKINGSVEISGNLLVGGGITMYSQRSLKNVLDERGLSLEELSLIKPTRYTWKDGRDSNIHFGGIADDIQQVLPEVVYKTKEGILTMDYGNAGFAIASSLIKPVVDHEQRIKALERENELLKQELNILRA